MGPHMAAQRLHLAAEGLHFAAQGPSMAHAADMQYMLHLAGPGWGPGWEGTRPGDGKVMIQGP